MNIKKTMMKTTTILFVVVSFLGCENDFDSIGSDIIGEPGFNVDLYDEAEISASNLKINSVQTNNLPLNLLGVYNDPLYGVQVANVLAQVALSAANPTFGNQAVVDSVVLNIPYFYSETEADDTGAVVYELDSVYGNSPIALSIEHSNLFLNSFDPESDFQRAQRYYSDMQPQIENNLTGNVVFETNNFVPSPEEVIIFEENAEGEQDTIRLPPRMRLKLSNKFFQERVINKAGSPELTTNNNFQNFLRGFYFQAEPLNNSGNLMMLNFRDTDAGITIYYTSEVADTGDEDDDGDLEELVDSRGTFRLNFGQSIVNTFEQDFPDFNDDNIYLKGGEGSMAIIDLFSGTDSDNDGVSDELEDIRENSWLINEANLIFSVNQERMAASREPERIYLYDLNSSRMLADYVFDAQGRLNDPASTSNENHLGVLQRDEDGNGVSYKVRITNHIRNIVNNDSTNVRLGLVVSHNVNIINNSAVRDAADSEVKRIPTSSVISPLGTVLHGPSAENEDKRLKLRIYYTEPKN